MLQWLAKMQRMHVKTKWKCNQQSGLSNVQAKTHNFVNQTHVMTNDDSNVIYYRFAFTLSYLLHIRRLRFIF